jgi:peptidyl-prolyl cis-trans isomerase B (cyclophilin B)
VTGWQTPARQPSINERAIASLICAFVFPPLGVIFGHLALDQIERSGQKGRGLAIAGLALGYLFTVIAIVGGLAIYLLYRYVDALYWPA